MTLRTATISFTAFAFIACGDQAPEGTEHQQAPILNGDPLGAIDAALSNAVSIRGGGFASGVLLDEKTVLTVKHAFFHGVIDAQGARNVPTDPTTMSVVLGNTGRDTSSGILGEPIFHPGFFRANNGLHPGEVEVVPIDLAVAKLKFGLTAPTGPFPVLECEGRVPSKLHCISGVLHQLDPKGRVAIPSIGTTNEATFPFLGTAGDLKVAYGPNTRFFSPDQATSGGDSGMGCYDTNTNRLSVIHTDDDTPDNPLAWVGNGLPVSPYCKWIKETAKPGARFAFQQQMDSDGVADLVALVPTGGDGFALTIDTPQLRNTPFTVTIANAPLIRAAAIGSFTGGSPTLAFVANGTLATTRFNNGPQPAITGAPSADYTGIVKARVSGDGIDDLVAQRADGTLDVFVGSASGLAFNANLHPVVLNLDNDPVPDFALLTGGAGVRTSSSKGSQASQNLNPATLRASVIKPGRFSRNAIAPAPATLAGIEGFVTLSQDTANGGVVVWCHSNGDAFICDPAMEARFANSARDPIALDTGDFNADGIDDVRVSYRNASPPPRFFFGAPNGFRSIPATTTPKRSFESFTTFDPNADAIADTIAFDRAANGNIVASVLFNDATGTEIGPIDTGINVAGPILALSGNFNGDGAVPSLANALVGNTLPFQDVVILVGDRVFALVSNGLGGFTVNTLGNASGFTAINLNDVNGDGLDDVEAKRADGSVTVFAGVAGSGGLETAGRNFTGLPTPESNDGKMVLLSGLGVDTVGATEARIKLTAGVGDTNALSGLVVQIFDGDNGGLHQFEEQTNLLKTCYRLSADPCGDSTAGNCAGGARPAVHIVTVSSDTLGDDRWDTIFDGPHVAAASLPGNNTAPFIYSLRVFMSEDCSTLPLPGSTLAVATADAFKVRSNGMVSQPAGEFSFVGSDSAGTFGVTGLPYMRDTNYDGTFRLPIAVGGSAREIQLKESDADDTQDATPGVSLGANSDIQYRLLRPNGTAASLVGAENTSAATVVANPSGNNNGVNALDVETRIHSFTTATAGTWIWEWTGVKATNAVHVFAPFGSPTTHEILGAARARPVMTTAEQPFFWENNDAELSQHLPIVVGNELSNGELEGWSFRVTTTPEAHAILANEAQTLEGELERQLLSAKLNERRGMGFGEHIENALVYGITTSVRTTVRDAEAVISGVDALADETKVSTLVTRLSSVNLGELTYRQPGVPFPDQPSADDDADGIVNLKDNCPVVANPLQEDSDDDLIGDACNVRPVVECVLERSPGSYDAFFQYDNPLSFRSIALGVRNHLENVDTALDAGQPTEFLGGAGLAAFRVGFADTQSLHWTLEDQTVVASSETERCSGRQLARLDFASNVALYGEESLEIGDHASVRAAGGLASVASGGDVMLGTKTVVGNVFSRGRPSIGRYAAVLGDALTVGRADLLTGAAVSGRLLENSVIRPHSLAWHIEFAPPSRDVEVGEYATGQLAPGNYGAVVVGPGAQLTLGAGRYELQSLEIDRRGSLIVQGAVTLHVASALSHHGETRLVGEASSLMVGYLGTEPAVVDASLAGTLVAPNSETILGSIPNSRYTGSFFAKRLVVRPDTVVTFAE